jgi:hypothetical protein
MTLVDTVLGWIDTNWGTFPESTSLAAPTRYNRDDGVRLDTGVRTDSVDLAENHAVSVASTPVTTRRPGGVGYLTNYEEAGVSVRVEAVHEDAFGTVAGDNEFGELVAETRRAINAERKQPPAPYYTLGIEDEDNQSANSTEYYRVDLTVRFRAYRDLVAP